jgi:hypothetical protein
MPQQYSAADSETGLEVKVTGEFPADPDDRVRIARTTNLFTKLMSTILATDSDYERRERFKAIETQLEVAEALIRGDLVEVQRLIRSTLEQMGVTEEQMREVERQLRDQLAALGRDDLGVFFSSDVHVGEEPAADEPSAEDDIPLDDRGLHDTPDQDDGSDEPEDGPPPEPRGQD